MARRSLLITAVAAVALLVIPAGAGAKVIKVDPTDSIQGAVDQAHPGDTIKVAPGTYREAGTPCPSEPGHTCAVVVAKDDISIVGQSGKHGKGVTLEAGSDQDEGIAVGKTADPACLNDSSLRVHGSLVRGITVERFEDDGVFLYCVTHWRVTHVVAVGNLEYGIFPSHSFKGRLDHSFASGANDTGLYIGQSFNSRMDHNVATDNVSGYEIENSVGVKADHNLSHGNTGGILSFTLPFLDVKVNEDNVIAKNIVRDNDRPNTCIDEDDAVCQVPPGTGILLVAADANRVRNNLVMDNDSFGIAVTNICLAQQLPQDVCDFISQDIQPDSDDNHVVSNTVLDNGLHPAPPPFQPIFAKDLVWDMTGVGNCWSNNVFKPRSRRPFRTASRRSRSRLRGVTGKRRPLGSGFF
ncbi:MAG: NosD domain-containing protein [Solirubrobacterales bacterium]